MASAKQKGQTKAKAPKKKYPRRTAETTKTAIASDRADTSGKAAALTGGYGPISNYFWQLLASARTGESSRLSLEEALWAALLSEACEAVDKGLMTGNLTQRGFAPAKAYLLNESEGPAMTSEFVARALDLELAPLRRRIVQLCARVHFLRPSSILELKSSQRRMEVVRGQRGFIRVLARSMLRIILQAEESAEEQVARVTASYSRRPLNEEQVSLLVRALDELATLLIAARQAKYVYREIPRLPATFDARVRPQVAAIWLAAIIEEIDRAWPEPVFDQNPFAEQLLALRLVIREVLAEAYYARKYHRKPSSVRNGLTANQRRARN